MGALGQIEGRDYLLIERYGEDNEARLPDLAAELIGLNVRFILATSQPSVVAAARVTRTVPIIGRLNDDPVENGMAKSLARPAGNISGVYSLAEELTPKRLSLLKQVVPSALRVGVLLRDDWPSAKRAWQTEEAAATQLGLELVALNVRSAGDLAAALSEAGANHLDGIITFRNPTVVTNLKLIAEQCRKLGLPAVFDAREYVDAGGLMSYGPNIDAIYRQLARFAVKLLNGTSVGEIPIEEPTKFELVINRRTADAIGIRLSPDILMSADQVIE
ncbi:ABC transporter substrate-binding protein [Bradyrhizobium sp. Tv2a-2]|uniref:ABC transporter substrate-binding protein n=1 Tax=Bradyrhizobium sp. Tv2a-2 TaxID=113395 RepID=UPI0003F645AA|nr:ABC transporter substrate-binding protein [Bradyrhizobium sp. Tv2a-2]